MKRFVQMVAILLLVMNSLPALAKTPRTGHGGWQIDAEAGFGEILDLWRSASYDELWQRTISTGRQSKESFVRRLSSSGHRPACCWEKMQDVTVTASDDRWATLQAKVGLEGTDGSMEYATKRFRMVYEDGLWKISMMDVLSLADKGKKKSRRR